MEASNQSKQPLRVGDRVEITFGESGRVLAIEAGNVQILLDSGTTITKSALEVEIVGIAHDFFPLGADDGADR